MNRNFKRVCSHWAIYRISQCRIRVNRSMSDCEKFVQLTSAPPLNDIPLYFRFPATIQENLKAQKSVRSNLSKLTEETIRAEQSPATLRPQALPDGQFGLIPNHLLSIDLFMVRNNDGGATHPFMAVPRHGSLNQVPRQF